MRRWIIFALLLGLLLGTSLPTLAQAPAEAVYAARGPYPVGTFDTTLPAGDGSPADSGPLAATVWYPALNPDGLPEAASYPWGEFTLQGEALRDAAPDPAGGPYPLVIFSHGLGGLRLQSLFYTEHLASYGFVVIAVDHPGSTLDADGRGADAADIGAGDDEQLRHAPAGHPAHPGRRGSPQRGRPPGGSDRRDAHRDQRPFLRRLYDPGDWRRAPGLPGLQRLVPRSAGRHLRPAHRHAWESAPPQPTWARRPASCA